LGLNVERAPSSAWPGAQTVGAGGRSEINKAVRRREDGKAVRRRRMECVVIYCLLHSWNVAGYNGEQLAEEEENAHALHLLTYS
jgi:hypothetical protein